MYPDYEVATAVSGVAAIVNLVLAIGIYVWTALALAAVFRKTGVPAWKAWVPVLNTWTLFTLGSMAGWWAIVLLVAGMLPLIVGVVLSAAAVAAQNVAVALLAPIAVGILGLGVLALTVILLIALMRPLNAGFGLGTGHVVLGVLLLPVWASVVGWGSARWLGARPASVDSTTATSRARADERPTPTSPFALGGAMAPPPPPAHHASPAPADGAASVAPSAPESPAATEAPTPPAANPWAPPPPPVVADPPAAPPAAAPPAAAPPAAAPPATAPPAAAPPATETTAPPAFPRVAAVPEQFAAPVSAASATPAVPTPPPSEDLDERTVLAARRHPLWALSLPSGATVSLTAEDVVLGRNPVPPAGVIGAQLIAVDDVSRTVSKTHALLRRVGSEWTITDLASTNGVFIPRVDGSEVEVEGTVRVDAAFYLGDAALTLRAEG